MDNSKYNSLLQPKVDEIKKICNVAKTPCFLAFGVEDKSGKIEIRGTCLLPELFDMDTEDRRFTDFVNVQNGFTTVPPGMHALDDMDMSDLAMTDDDET